MLLDDRCSSLNFLLAYVRISTVLSAQDTLKAFYSNNKINDYMISIKNNLEKRRDIGKKGEYALSEDLDVSVWN